MGDVIRRVTIRYPVGHPIGGPLEPSLYISNGLRDIQRRI